MAEGEKTMNMIIRNIPTDLHGSVKAAAAVERRSLQATIMSLMTLKARIQDPRSAAIDGVEFRLTPHRIDDSQDTADVWRWKLTAWAIDDDGTMKPFDARLI
jgi:plasmid stability protein